LVEPGDLSALVRLHQQEAVRFQRPLEDWRLFLARGPVYPYASREIRFYLVTQEGEPCAYAVLSVGERDGERQAEVVEYAGRRAALLGAVEPLGAELGTPHLRLTVPRHDTELLTLLRHRGLESRPGHTGGSVTVLDLPRLAGRLRPWFAERVGTDVADRLRFAQGDGRWSVTLDREELTLTEWTDVSRLAFGPPPDGAAVPLPDNALGEVLRTLFPLPRPEYGLSYI
jgi:hypothetical protein